MLQHVPQLLVLQGVDRLVGALHQVQDLHAYGAEAGLREELAALDEAHH